MVIPGPQTNGESRGRVRLVTELRGGERFLPTSPVRLPRQKEREEGTPHRAPPFIIGKGRGRGVLPTGRSLEVWLVRHGETEANAKRLTQGQQPGRLTRNGASQAMRLGCQLRQEHEIRGFDAVLCSDLLRCRQTASLATKTWLPREVPFFLDPNLRERSVGIYEGYSHGAPRPKRPSGISPRQYRAPDGESWDDVLNRAQTFLRRLVTSFLPPRHRQLQPICDEPLRTDDCVRVLVITHGGFIAETLNAARHADGVLTPFARNAAVNTSIYRILIEAKPDTLFVARVLASNDAKHLVRFRDKARTDDIDLHDEFPSLPPLTTSDPWWSAFDTSAFSDGSVATRMSKLTLSA